jgi:hypothetical protein
MKENPLLGLGRFPVHTAYLEESNINLESFQELDKAVHNMLANKLLHEGLIGFFIIILFIYIILKHPINVSHLDRDFYKFIKVYILSFLIYSMFNTSFSAFERIFLFISLGLLNTNILKNSRLTIKNKNVKTIFNCR